MMVIGGRDINFCNNLQKFIFSPSNFSAGSKTINKQNRSFYVAILFQRRDAKSLKIRRDINISSLRPRGGGSAYRRSCISGLVRFSVDSALKNNLIFTVWDSRICNKYINIDEECKKNWKYLINALILYSINVVL